MTDQQFIEAIAPSAVAFYCTHRISAALTIAQACLESGYGQHAPGNNLFGVKADPSWSGSTTTQFTRECVNDAWVTISAKFRAYPSLGASLADHAQFLLQPRYQNLVGANYTTACNEIAKVDGYATDPNYGTQLLEIIQEFGLAKYDLPTIKMGATGQYVVQLQERLNANGANPKLATDGDFGPATDKAVRAFQTRSKLTCDGVVGPQTWAALN